LVHGQAGTQPSQGDTFVLFRRIPDGLVRDPAGLAVVSNPFIEEMVRHRLVAMVISMLGRKESVCCG